ncbi:GNAT family N-acetyltransferase [Halobacterium bonnevillei]|uniref:GNAT family N-acetyltransferase n=1 Tax=Halobacterium bonnevillei TaxID=2692200 RepID=A0A6B0SDN1_9EURY|nr:GNAT family protein [Halobacterium bonnevillei]MXR19845.1 GNAT family N-acetyltransferase [Halobacterium bonnevillei]
MPGPAFTRGDTVSLHPIEEEDHEFIQRGRNHPDVRVPLTDTRIRTLTDVAESVSEDDYRFLICIGDEDGDPQPVGEVAFAYVAQEAERGALMYWIHPDHRGNGYVTEASELFLEYAFGECGFHKVTARVLVSNEASARTLEKLGFQREGTRRESSIIDGEYEDMYTYGLLDHEWLD